MPLRKKILFYLMIITTIIYSVWRIFFSLPWQFGTVDIVCGILLLISELIGFIEVANYMSGMTRAKELERPDIAESEYPDVDVFITTYNEEKELLYKTVNGCLYMDYPDKSKVHIYLLDDGDRGEIKELAQEMCVGYFRRDNNEGAKAGNLNNALRQTTSPLVAIFDADMIPMHDFLTELVPHFFMDRYEKDENGTWIKLEEPDPKKEVGFIQSPQSFYNTDLFQYNLYSERDVPNEQNYFFKTIQLARNVNNSAILAGSNAILSRKALEDVGGFYEKSITEDIATGLKMQSKGYRGYSLGDVHANGLSPTDLRSLIRQRNRWARGCIQTIRQNHIILNRGLSFGQKFNYFACKLYWYTPWRRIVFMLSPILASVCGLRLLGCTLINFLIVWLPHYILFSWTMSSLTGNVRNSRLSNIYDTIVCPHLLLGVLLETFGIKKKSFSVTNKSHTENTLVDSIRLSLVHIILSILSIIGIAICINDIVMNHSGYYLVVLFWLCVNLYVLLVSIFFYLGRKYKRKTERTFVKVPLKIYFNGREIETVTDNISEGGLAFSLGKPYYIPDDEELRFELQDEERHYRAETKGVIVHTDRRDSKWVYSVRFTGEIEGQDKRELLQIIYDRVPTLPMKINRNSSYYADFKNNLSGRMNKDIISVQKLHRAELNRWMETEDHRMIQLMNFNYKYALVQVPSGFGDGREITVPVNDRLSMRMCLEDSPGTEKSQSVRLYRILNYYELADDTDFVDLLSEWMGETDSVTENGKVKIKAAAGVFNEMDYI